MSDRERQIRDLAHQIWEEAGRPTGEDARHWAEAERRYAAEQKPTKRDAKTKSGKASKPATPGEAKGAKVKTPKGASGKTTLPPPDTAAVPKTAEAAKPKSKAGRSAANDEPAKAKARGKAKA